MLIRKLSFWKLEVDILDSEDISSYKAGKDIIAANHPASPTDEELSTVSDGHNMNNLERMSEGSIE